MDLTQLFALLGPGGLLGLGSLAVAIYAAVTSRRMTTIEAFDKLCTQLTNRLAVVEEELRVLRAENTALKERVRELENERDQLKAQIAALTRKRASKRGRKGE